MKINFTLIAFLLFAVSLMSQIQPCLPADDGIPAGNTAPGCLLTSIFYAGNNGNNTATEPWSAGFPCEAVENNQFISIIPDSTGSLRGSLLSSNCNLGRGIEMILYNQNFTPVSNCFRAFGGNRGADIIIDGLTPGEVYWMMFDGMSGDVCNIILTLAGNTYPGDTLRIKKITSSTTAEIVCKNSEICYSFEPVENATGYAWFFPKNAQIMSGGTESDTFVCLQYTEIGLGIGAVGATFAPGELVEYRAYYSEVSVFHKNIDTLLCPGEGIKVADIVFDAPGTFRPILENVNDLGCDSTYLLKITMPEVDSFEINCFLDTFINAISFDWDAKPHAERYQVFINGSLVNIQTFTSYLYSYSSPQEDITFEVLPVSSSHFCMYEPGIITCSAGALSNSNEIIVSKIFISPNPSSGEFAVFSKQKVKKIEVFDFSGRKKKEFFDSKIDISKYDSGVYFLKIHSDEKVFLKKVIKI